MCIRKISFIAAALVLPWTLQGQGLILPETLVKAGSRTVVQEVLANNISRAVTLSAPRVPAMVALPVQQVAPVPLNLDEVHRQLATNEFTPLFLSSFLRYTRQPQYSFLLHKHLLGLSLRGAYPSLADQPVLQTQLRRDMQIQLDNLRKHRIPADLQQNIAQRSVAGDLVRLASSISGIGLYGGAEDVATLRKVYLDWGKTPFEPLFLMWVSRSLITLGAKEDAHALMSGAPASLQKEHLEKYFTSGAPTEGEKTLRADAQMEGITPLINEINPNATFAFDSSALSTAYFVEWKKMISNIAAAADAEPALVPVKTGGVKPPELSRQMRIYQRLNRRYGRAYPSGLEDEERIIQDWLEYYKNGYFKPRNQIEVIEGMSAAKANNIMEYLYYMTMPDAEDLILKPLRETGRLPEFMYSAQLIAGTHRLPFGYYKNKFNENIARFVELAEEDGTIYTHNVELKDLITSMKDYTFKQGFMYRNSSELTQGLRKNWEELVRQIEELGVRADRRLVNKLWKKPVRLSDGTMVSLRDYFTQTRHSFASDRDVAPSFYLNSPKWVAWENERRDLRAKEKLLAVSPEDENLINRMQRKWVLKNPDDYLTLEQFADVMRASYMKSYGRTRRVQIFEQSSDLSPSVMGIRDEVPSSTTIKVNNFDKLGGVCQMSFTDGGYMGPVRAGYDGTSTVARFDPQVFDNVEVVVFDVKTLEPQVVTLDKVSYLKDLKSPDINKVRASTMVSDGLDLSRDLLTVEKEEQSLLNIPHLRATIYPRSRLSYADKIPYMYGGGLAGYLALFTPDFYPIKKVRMLREIDGKKQWVTQYYVRKEVASLAGMIHRERLTFAPQVQDRVVKEK